MRALGRDIFARQPSRKLRHLRMGDSRGTAGGTYAAHDAVETFLRAFRVFAPLRVGDVLHDVKPLRTAFRAGVAADTRINFGIQLHHDLLRGLDLLDVVNLFDEREEGQRGDVHPLLDLRLTGEAGFQFLLSLDAVDRGAGAAETVAAAAAAHQLIARVFHRFHNGQAFGHLIPFAEQVNVYQIFHAYSPSLNTRRAVRPTRPYGTRGRPCRRICRRRCTFRICRCRTSCEAPTSCRRGIFRSRVRAAPKA